MSVLSRLILCVPCLAAMLTSLQARAEPDQTPTESPQVSPAPPWRVTLWPGVWLARVTEGATSKLGPGPLAGQIKFKDQLSLRDLEAAAAIDLSVDLHERWQLHAGGFDFSVSDNGAFPGISDFGALELRPGDRYKADLDLSSVAADIAYRAWAPQGIAAATGICFSPLVAVRYVDIDQRVEEIGVGVENTGGQWTALMAGIQFDLRWTPQVKLPFRRLHLMTALAGGPALGGDGGSVFQLRTAANLDITDHFGLVFGFRLLHLNVEDGEYEFDGGLQGLFLAGSIRF